MSRPALWPVRVKRGNSTVSIYRVNRKKNGRAYQEFKLAYYNEVGKRLFQSFSTFERARQAADNVNVGFMKGEVKSLVLTNEDKVVYLRALKALQPDGTPLDLAAHQFAEAAKLLGGASLLEAARYYIRRHPGKLPRKSVQEVIEEFIESRRQARRDEHYIASLRSHLRRFSDAHHTAITDLSRADVLRFLNGLGLSPRSQYNFAKSLRTYFAFARERGYLSKDDDELQAITAGDADPGEIEIYTPAEMTALLSVAKPEMVPILTLGGFAGLRSCELERLNWSVVQLARGFIEVKQSVSKTGQRRLVPIAPNLARWLAPYAQENGPVWTYSHSELTALKAETAEAAGFKWRHNALRHSFASYRLAQLQNANQVSLETGHTVKVLFGNYRELVTPDEAKAWFNIVPEEIGLVEISTPAETKALLQAAPAAVIPALALCAFSGLSCTEVERLDWAEINLAESVMAPKELNQPKEKKARSVPILPNLAEWLKGYARASGPVWSQAGRSLTEVLSETAQKADAIWKEKGLIHSYASYRLALVPDAQQVAWETGRSPHTVFTNFSDVVRSEEANSWFEIVPLPTASTAPSRAAPGEF